MKTKIARLSENGDRAPAEPEPQASAAQPAEQSRTPPAFFPRIRVSPIRLRSSFKRVFDVAVSLMALVLLAPLLLCIGILVKLESRGPILYRHERVGRSSRPFTMYKFRSMQAAADPSHHREYVTMLIEQNLTPATLRGEQSTLKLKHDARITRLGGILRQTSLDELPQLVNVLKGEMSLVGPRPPLAYEVELYKEWHRGRLDAIPGMTGLWQVNGRNRVSFDDMVRMDLDYIARQSLWLDIKILLKTPWAVISGRGAG